MNWVVYTWNLQLTCKNALIDAVVSWVVYTWKILEKNWTVLPLRRCWKISHAVYRFHNAIALQIQGWKWRFGSIFRNYNIPKY